MVLEHEERLQIIEGLIHNAESRFGEYLASPDFKPGNLDLSPEVLRVFIPRRIYELTNDPDKIRIFKNQDEVGCLGFSIVEKDRPYSIPKKFPKGHPKASLFFNHRSLVDPIDNPDFTAGNDFVYLTFSGKNTHPIGSPHVFLLALMLTTST